MGLEKAKFQLDEDNVIEVQFNPNQYTLTYSKEVEKKYEDLEEDYGIVSGTNDQARELKMELIFDSYKDNASLISKVVNLISPLLGIEDISVNDRIEQFTELIKTSQDEMYNGITFAWGTFIFHGIINSFDTNYTMFSSEGEPVRATMNLSITESPDPNGGDIGLGGIFGDLGDLSDLDSLNSLGDLSSILPS